jgi:DNA-directed RNA polymerase specialized sigma24 family protein
MKRDATDYFIIEPHQVAIHERLCNWARWVEVRRGPGRSHPMWAKSRSNARQWHSPEPRDSTNPLDAQAMEKAVGGLPEKHREAIRWYYVFKGGPLHMARTLGVSKDGLLQLTRDGRQMLTNRRV